MEAAIQISSHVNAVVNSEQAIDDCRQHQSELIGLGTYGYLLQPRVSTTFCALEKFRN